MPDRPDLAALLPSIESVDALPAEHLPGFVAGLAALQARVAARMAVAVPESHGDADRLLDIEQAAERLGTSPDWLRRHGGPLPFTIYLSAGQVRYSLRKLEQWITLRAGKGPC
jgi:hypothetical protein